MRKESTAAVLLGLGFCAVVFYRMKQAWSERQRRPQRGSLMGPISNNVQMVLMGFNKQ